jgi:hypothetical protein
MLALGLVLVLSPWASALAGDAPCVVSPEVESQIRQALPDAAESIFVRFSLACAEGFPLKPFEDKLTEGLAKGVPPARISEALDRKLDAYRHGAAMLRDCGVTPTPEVLVPLGEGLFGKVPYASLHDCVCTFAAREPDQFLVGLEMTVLLSRAGFDYALTRSLLDAGFQVHALTDPWRYFVRVVLVARGRGLTDRTVAEAARGVLLAGGLPSDVSSRLGFTDRDLSGRSLNR